MTATLLLAVLLAGGSPDNAIDRLADPDPAVRRAAVEGLRAWADDPATLDLLRDAADDPRPAVAAAARAVLRDVELGLDGPTPLTPTDRALAAVAREGGDAEERLAALRGLLDRLPMTARPVARVLVGGDAEYPPQAVAGVVARGEPQAIPAVVAALLDVGGEPAAAAFVEAAGWPAPLFGPAAGTPAWFDGRALAAGQAPSPARAAAFEILHNRPDAARRHLETAGLSPAADALARAVIAQAAGDADAARRARLDLRDRWADGDDVAAIAGGFWVGDPLAAFGKAQAESALTAHGLLWVRGEWARFVAYPDDPRWRGRDQARVREQLRRVLQVHAAFFNAGGLGRGGQPRAVPEAAEPAGLERLRLDAHAALRDPAVDAGPMLARLAALEPHRPEWRALAGDGDTAARMSLDLWDVRLRAARFADAYAAHGADPAAGEWARDELLRASSAALLAPADRPAAGVYATTSAARVAVEAGDWDLAARAAAAAALACLDLPAVPEDEARSAYAPYARPAPRAVAALAELERARLARAAAAGDWRTAREAHESAVRLAPGEPSATIAYVRALDAAGRGGEADAIFRDRFAVVGAAVRELPTSALVHNQTAWLAARCGRRLDTAGDLARTALQLEPGNANYLDTLAEIEAASGRAAAAGELMDRVVATCDADELPTFLRRREAVARGE